MQIYGRNAILEALAGGQEIEKIFICFGLQGETISRIHREAGKHHVPCVISDKRKFLAMEREVCGENGKAQGVIALMTPFPTFLMPELIEKSYAITDNPLLVALDGITDPHNLGAIARSAECAGAQGLVLPERNSAPMTNVVIKTSAGALEHLPVAKVGNLSQAITDAKNAGFWIIGTDDNAEHLYTEKLYDRPILLIIGSEGDGLRHLTREKCDSLIKIPMSGKISSLNASVAAGIVMFEIQRQRASY